MPAPIAKAAIVITVAVIAAGIAAYESPEVRKWVDQSRRKIEIAIRSLGDELSPKVKQSKKKDPSMDEEKTNEAEERRRQARQEILERGRILEERRRQKREGKVSNKRDSGFGSFDSLVDKDGNLRQDTEQSNEEHGASTTAVDHSEPSDGITKRNTVRAVDASIPLRDLSPPPSQPPVTEPSAFPSSYEDELRRHWNLPLPPVDTTTTNRHAAPSTHTSDSLVDLTPTSSFPDPDIALPDPFSSHHSSHNAPSTSSYFSIPNPDSGSLSSTTPSQGPHDHQYHHHNLPPSRTLSPSFSDAPNSNQESQYYYAHPSAPHIPLPNPPHSNNNTVSPIALSSAASTASTSSLEHIRQSEYYSHNHSVAAANSNPRSRTASASTPGTDSDDDDDDDGIRTPEGSVWTDVGSEVSGSAS